MNFLANLIWIIFGGLFVALTWLVLGLILCVTIIGIPFGLQCFKAARLSLAPFGRRVDVDFAEHPIANVLWAILVGWEMALGYLLGGLVLCITIIGIPMGLQMFKFMKLAFFPFGADIK